MPVAGAKKAVKKAKKVNKRRRSALDIMRKAQGIKKKGKKK